MLIVVAYDVPDDRRRTRIADMLKDFGIRVQWSVFECLLEDTDIARLRFQLGTLINASEDSIRIYRVCASCEEALQTLGIAGRTEDPNVFVL